MPKKILLHVCCGPCAIMPVRGLQEAGFAVTGLFANPNIHPLSEYLRRREAMQHCAEKLALPMLWRDDVWNVTAWLRAVAGTRDAGAERCAYCYDSRLEITARMAAQGGYASFSSSLLYSRHQNHENIVALAKARATEYGVAFHYQDFRPDWQQGIDISKELELYRQPYCGCVYSEAERYAKKLKKLLPPENSL